MNNQIEKIQKFIQKYENQYPEKITDYIKQNLDNDLENEYRFDFMNQIYSHLSLIPKDKDQYIQFINILKKYYDIHTNILEIGAGRYPALAEKINQEQIKIKKGTITAYDPNLILTKLNNIKLQKKEFSTKEIVNEYNLIIGFWPCHATELIINTASKNKKEFSIVLCDCMHKFPKENKNIIFWQDYIYELAKSSIDNQFKIQTDYIEHGEETASLVLSCVKNKH